MYKTVKDMYIGDNQQLKVKLVRGWQRTEEDYCHHNKLEIILLIYLQKICMLVKHEMATEL